LRKRVRACWIKEAISPLQACVEEAPNYAYAHAALGFSFIYVFRVIVTDFSLFPGIHIKREEP
jgi:hypothetical protein